MNCKHKHQSCCKHENVKYCKCCQKVYCEDCGKEWGEYFASWSPHTRSQWPITYAVGTDNQIPAKSIPTDYEITCSHDKGA